MLVYGLTLSELLSGLPQLTPESLDLIKVTEAPSGLW